MAEVAQAGEALLADIAAAEGAAFWWMGQHSFILKAAGRVIYIDPYLGENAARQTPPLLKPEQVTNANWVLCTHDHSDHIDPEAIPGIAAASPGARFVAPRPHAARMRSLSVPEDRLRTLDADEVLEEEGLRVTAIKAKHEFFDYQPGVGHPFLGYVIEVGGATLYHSGDTLVFDGLLTTLQRWRFDAVFLPINGRDAQRYRGGCIGNMTWQEAVDLAGELRPALAVPTHYDMFKGNSEDPQKFLDYLEAKFPGVPAWVGPAGARVDLPR